MPTSGSILGNPVRRREDPGILTGQTQYFDDLQIAGMTHVAFVRSTIAHAKIDGIDTSDAVSMPGVVAVYTADDLDLPDHHGFMMLPPTMNRPPLARERVRFVGDIVAMVVAETKAQAVDAAEAVIVDYDPLPVIVDMEAALLDDAPAVRIASRKAFFPSADIGGPLSLSPGVVRSPVVSKAKASHWPILSGSNIRPSFEATTSKPCRKSVNRR